VDDNVSTPFASVTFFVEDFSFVPTDGVMELPALEKYIDSKINTKNVFYAIKVEGEFHYVKTRSVYRQKEPYPPLKVALKNQPVFEFKDVKGVLVGFRCPDYIVGINVPGYHFHFLTEDRKAGGYLLELKAKRIGIKIDLIGSFFMSLPEKDEFRKADLGENKPEELDMMEK